MIVIGSQALDYHGLLKGRIPSDFDILEMRQKEILHISGVTVDVMNASEPSEPTNLEIYHYCQTHGFDFMETPLGEAIVAPLEILKVLKLSSLPLDKLKHQQDLEALRGVQLDQYLMDLTARRTLETERKVLAQKEKFFNKFLIPRFMDHDELHKYVNPYPNYLKILLEDSSTEIDPVKFDHLNFKSKKRIIWEETFVLALERQLIPAVRKTPYFIEELVEKFSRVEKSSDPSHYWLSRLSTNLKDHPEWLRAWCQNNSTELLKGFEAWWDQTLNSLPEEFWARLLEFK